ncbi:alpha/beta fold hydrolase [Actinoplanes flavus]|uniref:Alpha/beta fold hydrolase n=1 Tax=Actinoplanes flavus TaxID=2820290 RepID=A0ABS3UG16_9ACTN|nr:alpha/beta fold hydrolase [Actinoplanes flavus]MBO3737722.1 alpha/beta fold hydrolase [Actinoplanes flavus]
MQPRRITHAHGTPKNLLVYDRWGRFGRPVVLLHGLGHDRTMWWPVAADLGDDCAAVTIDLPGHGQSAERTDHDLGRLAHDLAMLISGLNLNRAPILVGHAEATLLADAFAGRYTTHAVITVDQADTEPDLEALPELYRQFAARQPDLDLQPMRHSWAAHLPARRLAVNASRVHVGAASAANPVGACLPHLRDPAGFADLLRGLT